MIEDLLEGLAATLEDLAFEMLVEGVVDLLQVRLELPLEPQRGQISQLCQREVRERTLRVLLSWLD